MAKIGFVSDVVHPWITGGVELTQHKEMSELSKRHTVYSFSLRFPGMAESFTESGIHYIGVAPARASEIYRNGTRSIRLAGRFARHLPLYLRRYDLDLIYANSFPYLHLGYVKRYCRSHSCRLVLDVAEVWTLREWSYYLGYIRGYAAYLYMRAALRGADVYVANSSTTARRLIDIAGVPKRKIRVFSPVIDINNLKKYRNERKSSTVIYAGRLIREKHAIEWCDAVAAAYSLDPKINGLIIGNGPERASISTHIKRNRYSFIKMVPLIKDRVKLYRRISKSSVLLNMSEREGLSAISLESLALGTPVVLPDYTPIPNEVRRMCVVATPDKIPSVLAKIATSKGKSRFMNKVSLSRFDVKRTNAFFESLIAGRPRHPGE